jgi:hypothetical protein
MDKLEDGVIFRHVVVEIIATRAGLPAVAARVHEGAREMAILHMFPELGCQ